jgi:hypothetical protein
LFESCKTASDSLDLVDNELEELLALTEELRTEARLSVRRHGD